MILWSILHRESRIGPKLEEDLECSFEHVHFEELWGYIAVESKLTMDYKDLEFR